MLELNPEVSLTAWPRWLVALAPDRPPQPIDPQWTDALLALVDGRDDEAAERLARAFPELVARRDDAGTTVAETLARLDEQYLGWWLALHPQAASRLATQRERLARPRLHGAHAWSALPASTLVRALLVERLAPARVLLLDDPDGLSLLLAGERQVTVLPCGAGQRQWLAREAARAGLTEAVELVSDPTPLGDFDLAVLSLGEPRAAHATLELALAAVHPGGRLVVAVRAPWARALYRLLAESGLTVRECLRDVDHAVLPGGFPIDGGGDLLVVDRPAHATAPARPSAAAALREQPFALVEIENLAAARLDGSAIDRFAAAVELMAPRPQAMRDSIREPQRDVLWWYDLDGYGFSAELRHDKAHLSLAFAPLEPVLLSAALSAAFATLGDAWTRTFALRTTHGPEGMVLT